jgi:FkbH-like protein
MKLVGYVDASKGGSIEGWALDEENPGRKVPIELSASGRSLIIEADQFRADLKTLGDGHCAFRYFDPDFEHARILFADTGSPVPRSQPHRSYHAPANLRITERVAERVLIIGSCTISLLPAMAEQSSEGTKCDYLLITHGGELPAEPPRPLHDYDFQVVQIPLRIVMRDSFLMRQEFADTEGYERLLADATAVLDRTLDSALRWSDESGVPAFVCNFMLPQQNAMGRLFPRYHLSNPVFFFEQLNRALAKTVSKHKSAKLLDLDGLAAIYGRRFVQDDASTIYTHGGILDDYDSEHDRQRLEKVLPLTEQLCALREAFVRDVWEEVAAAYRTIRQVDAVKLVVIDLDDTLWRGVLAEEGQVTEYHTEGWPVGFAEALTYLKRRGVLLAILSRNDPERIRALWPDLYGNRLLMEDFAAAKISWNPKVDGMAELLGDLNLLPRNTLFVDDNPVERAAMTDAFPGIRTLGANPYELRRIMLWAPEMQVSTVTAESARRTEMIRAQIGREATRRALPRDEFLRSLEVQVDLYQVEGPDDPRWPRTFELLNKTNQFNTTGKRWTQAEMTAALSDGLTVYAFEVADKFTRYGLVGVLLVEELVFQQFVMSCRVLGLEAELAVIATLADHLGGAVMARLVETDANMPCRDVWVRAGFSRVGDVFKSPPKIEIPHHTGITFAPPLSSDRDQAAA